MDKLELRKFCVEIASKVTTSNNPDIVGYAAVLEYYITNGVSCQDDLMLLRSGSLSRLLHDASEH